jgi:hypothetical protein
MTRPAAGAMNTADAAGLVRSELTDVSAGRGYRYFAADGTRRGRECYVLVATRCARGH